MVNAVVTVYDGGSMRGVVRVVVVVIVVVVVVAVVVVVMVVEGLSEENRG